MKIKNSSAIDFPFTAIVSLQNNMLKNCFSRWRTADMSQANEKNFAAFDVRHLLPCWIKPSYTFIYIHTNFMYIHKVCKRNGYSVSDLDYLFNCLLIPFFTYCIRVWGVAAYTKYLSQIDRLVRRPFRFGYIQHELSIQQVIKYRCETLEKYYGCFLASPEGPPPPNLRTGLYAIGRILTRSHVFTQRGLRNAL